MRQSITRLLDYPIPRFALLAALVAFACSVTPRDSITLSVVGTNDLHGRILGEQGRGGLALLDGYLRNLRAARARDGGAVLLLDAGDLFQGTLESNLNEGAVVISAYNALHYDAAAIGNHEFDYGPAGPATAPQSADDDPVGALKARTAQATFPFVAANILDNSTSRPIAWRNVTPSVILTVGGVRVGVVGLTTLETLGATLSANTRGLDVVPLAPALETEARRLRADGATVIVATAHAGGRCTEFVNPADLSSCAANAEIFNVARALPAGLVDVIVAGHRHEGIAHEVNGVAVISSYSAGRAFGRIDLTVDRGTGRATNHHIFPPHDVCERDDPATGKCATPGEGTPAQYEGTAIEASQQIAAILAPAVEVAQETKQKSLNTMIEGTVPRGEGETAAGDLLADWTRAAAGSVDAAVINSGGVRTAVPAGPLTYGRLYELTPFDNREARLTLTGAELATVVRENLSRRGDMIVLSGIRATATCGVGGLHVSLQRESGKPIADREVLSVVTSDFLATNGSDLFAPVMPFRTEATLDGPILRDAIAEWLTRTSGSWRAGDFAQPAHRRLVYEGTRPVRCGGR
jgi:2',3'-cyclic-nucleotide 2'-phosphodiesterase (5'-nucleotidase family)